MSLATDVSVRVRPIWHAEFVQAVVDAAEPFVPTAKPEKKEVEETTDWLRAFLGFLKMGGSPSHHGFQYVSMLRCSNMTWMTWMIRGSPSLF
jgi:hypothetical protein